LATVDEARAAWIAAEETTGAEHDPQRAAALSGRQVVAEGWDMLDDQFLWPALLVGHWHDDPWSGLRTMVAAWEEAGADVWPARHTSGPAFAADVLPSVMRREPDLARLLLPPEWPHADEPTAWEDRPTSVDERMIRRQVSVALDAAQVATGRPVPATFDALASVLEGGWATTVVGILAGSPEAEEIDAVISQIVTETATLCLLDSSAASLMWTWTDGSTLVDAERRPIDVAAAVRDYRAGNASIDVPGMRGWLRRHGADPSAPVWLEEGATPAPEAPLLEIGAVRLLRPQRVVVTTHAVRFCKYKLGGAPWPRPSNEQVTNQGVDSTIREDLHEIAPSFPLSEIVSAEVSPLATSHRHWRLRVRTADRTRSVWTSEKRDDVVPTLAAALNDRLSLTWWAVPAPVRWARNAWAFVLSGVGGVIVIFGILWVIDPLPDMRPGFVEQGVMIVGGAFLFTLAYLPDWLLRHFRGRTARRLAPLRVGPREHEP
jgi:hypothetical protein